MSVRNILLAGCALALSASIASAADLPSRKAPPEPYLPMKPVGFSWTGFYLGVNGGYAWGPAKNAITLSNSWGVESAALQNRFTQDGGATLSPGGFSGGVQAGYNVQMGSGVFGFEADVNYMDLSKAATNVSVGAPTYTFNRGVKADWLMTIRPRLGVAIDRTLLYLTGGLAIANVKDTWSVASTGGYLKSFNQTDTRIGWVIGGGVEHAFTNNWTIKAEYLFADLGSLSNDSLYLPGSTFAPPGANYTETLTRSMQINIARVGLNYKF